MTAPASAVEPVEPAQLGLVAAYAAVLEAFHNTRKRFNDTKKELDRLRDLVDQIPAGTHGHWRKHFGDPSRIVDRDQLNALLVSRGLEMPFKDGNPKLEVDYIGPDSA